MSKVGPKLNERYLYQCKKSVYGNMTKTVKSIVIFIKKSFGLTISFILFLYNRTTRDKLVSGNPT